MEEFEGKWVKKIGADFGLVLSRQITGTIASAQFPYLTKSRSRRLCLHLISSFIFVMKSSHLLFNSSRLSEHHPSPASSSVVVPAPVSSSSK
ncbi:hypothetical protein AKJ16_DCAP22163 [Drosera capensis]